MPAPHRVRVLSSYIYDDPTDVPYREMGRKNRWFHGFVKTLTRTGSSLRDFDIRFVRLPPPPDDLARLAVEFESERVDLLICAGTDAVLRWVSAGRTIPVLYFGAHPENHGLDVAARDYVSGVRLNLPLVWSPENFALIHELVAEVRDVFVPLNLDSPFAFPGVRTNFELFRRRGAGAWISAPSTYLGYRSVSFLARCLGCGYHEAPFAGLDELERCLREIPSGSTNAIVGFNDIVLLEGAVDRLLAFVRARRMPLFWINNASVVQAGGVADFSSDFEKVGERLGEMSLAILRDRTPMCTIPFEADQGERFTLNLRRCAELGITPGDGVRARFHAVFA
jgi:ABC-type uncharacterized transport system substrate-binding protein